MAGETDFKSKTVAPPAAYEVPLTVLNLRSIYTFESDFERGGGNASGDSWFNSVTVSRRFPISLPWPNDDQGSWYFRAGAEYSRFDFNNSGDLPLPSNLQNVNALLAIEYLVQGETAILIETAPGFYFENEIDGDSFDAPTKAALAVPLSKSFYLVGGATYRGRFEKYPIWPVLGAVWFINDHWTLNLVAPAPRLTYKAADNLRFWVGGDLGGGSYRTDDDQDRQGNLRNAALAYSEYRAGVGVVWGDPDRAALDLGAGYTFKRKFDYHRAEEGFETDEGAPFIRLGFRGGF